MSVPDLHEFLFHPKHYELVSSESPLKSGAVPEAVTTLFRNNELMAHAKHGFAVEEQTATDAKRVVVVGGGTAGYFAALALRRHLPHLEITLIEAPSIPIIGVGEATVGEIVPFLHHFLGIDIHDFTKKVRPTWKQGIRFLWGLPGDYRFEAPFDWELNNLGLLGSLDHGGDINNWTVQSYLMHHDLTPLVRMGEEVITFLEYIPFAYHLDNAPFVAYLKGIAHERGIKHLDRKIADVELAEEGGETKVAAIITDENERLEFDFFIDCTGFRGTLMEKLEVPFLSFSNSLFTDAAVTFNLPHGGKLKPYTTAKTMQSGWCWIIPVMEDDHLGYVHSSEFCSVDQAIAEAESTFGQKLVDPRVVRFRSGRRTEFWRGNVFAVGNACGFVEPLESTGLLAIHRTVQVLVRSFPRHRRDVTLRPVANAHVARLWDGFRWFLSIHYKFNQKYDSKFWKACRNDTDVSAMQPLIDLFQNHGPLTYLSKHTSSMLRSHMEATCSLPYYGFSGFDCIMMGQKVPTKLPPRFESSDAWRERLQTVQFMAANALSQAEAHRHIQDHPEILDRLINTPGGWVHRLSELYQV